MKFTARRFIGIGGSKSFWQVRCVLDESVVARSLFAAAYFPVNCFPFGNWIFRLQSPTIRKLCVHLSHHDFSPPSKASINGTSACVVDIRCSPVRGASVICVYCVHVSVRPSTSRGLTVQFLFSRVQGLHDALELIQLMHDAMHPHASVLWIPAT